MKRMMLLSAIVMFSVTSAFSQNYIVVNTDTIFRSVDEFNRAVEEIDAFAKEKQATIDEAYVFIEELFNSYVANRNSMTDDQRMQAEAQIADNENRVLEFQESIFGQDGELARMRSEKIEPLQRNILNIITRYAADNNLGLVIDIATNPIIIYFAPEIDRTQDIINLLHN